MSFKQQHQYNFVEDNLPDLRLRYTKCNIIPMMITKCILLINSAFENGFKNKLGYFIRTIPDTSTLLLPIEDIIRNRFILAMTSRCRWNEEEQNVSSISANLIWKISNSNFSGTIRSRVQQQNINRTNNWHHIQQMKYTVDELAIKKN